MLTTVFSCFAPALLNCTSAVLLQLVPLLQLMLHCVHAHLPTMSSCFPRLAMWKKYLSIYLSLLVSNVTFNPKVEVLVGMSWYLCYFGSIFVLGLHSELRLWGCCAALLLLSCCSACGRRRVVCWLFLLSCWCPSSLYYILNCKCMCSILWDLSCCVAFFCFSFIYSFKWPHFFANNNSIIFKHCCKP